MSSTESTRRRRPLVVTDCDEVLLHMVVPFREWLDEAHAIEFRMNGASFAGALRRRKCGSQLEREEVWPLLSEFFTSEMHRQYAAAGAFEALARIGERADIVVLSNVGEEMHARRVAQLQSHGLDCRLVANRGEKGPPLKQIIAEHDPLVTVFVEDLEVHHESAATHAPEAWRLQMVIEPEIAGHIPAAAHAHARIDHWEQAGQWIMKRIEGAGAPPPLDSKQGETA